MKVLLSLKEGEVFVVIFLYIQTCRPGWVKFGII